jgi:hypothetical protein
MRVGLHILANLLLLKLVPIKIFSTPNPTLPPFNALLSHSSFAFGNECVFTNKEIQSCIQ